MFQRSLSARQTKRPFGVLQVHSDLALHGHVNKVVPSGKLKATTSVTQLTNSSKVTVGSKRVKHHSLHMAPVEKMTNQQVRGAWGKRRSPLGVSSRFAQMENRCFEQPLDRLTPVPTDECVHDVTHFAQSKPIIRESDAVLFYPCKPTDINSDCPQLVDTPSKRMTFIKDDPALPDTPLKRMTFIKDDPALPDTPMKRMTFIKNDPIFPETPSKRMTFIKDDPSLPMTPIRRTTFMKSKSAMPNTPIIACGPESPIPSPSHFGGSKLAIVGQFRCLSQQSPRSPNVHSLTEIAEDQDDHIDDHCDLMEENMENIDPEQSVSEVLAARFVRLRQLADGDDSDSGHSEENDCSFTSPPSTHYESALSGSETDLSEDEVFEDSVASLPVAETSVKNRELGIGDFSAATEFPKTERLAAPEEGDLPGFGEFKSTEGMSECSDDNVCSDSIEDQGDESDASYVISSGDHSPDSLNDKPVSSTSTASCDVATSSGDVNQPHSDDSEWHSPAQLLAQSTNHQMALPDNVVVEMQHRLSSTPLARPSSVKGFVAEMSTLAEMPSPIIGQRVDQATVTKVPRPSLYTLGPTWARIPPETAPTTEGTTFDISTTVTDVRVINTVTVTKSKMEHVFETPVNPSKELFPSRNTLTQQCLSETKVLSHLGVECDISGVQEVALCQNAGLGKRSFAQSETHSKGETSEFLHPSPRAWMLGQKRGLDRGAPVTRSGVMVVKKVRTSRTVGSVAQSVSLTTTSSSCLTRSTKHPGTQYSLMNAFVFWVKCNMLHNQHFAIIF